MSVNTKDFFATNIAWINNKIDLLNNQYATASAIEKRNITNSIKRYNTMLVTLTNFPEDTVINCILTSEDTVNEFAKCKWYAR